MISQLTSSLGTQSASSKTFALTITLFALFGAPPRLAAAESSQSNPPPGSTSGATMLGPSGGSSLTPFLRSTPPDFQSPNQANAYIEHWARFPRGREQLGRFTKYYPPDPPALGEPVPRRSRSSDDQFSPPPLLGVHVYEPFYAPLSHRLVFGTLSDSQEQRLEAYREIRGDLIAEIRERMDALRDRDTGTREKDLSALAAAQAHRLEELTTMAEELRTDLVRDTVLENQGHTEASDDSFPAAAASDPRIRELQILRYTAAFQHGLSTAQRGLLRENVMELAHAILAPAGSDAFLYFSPSTSRFRVPAGLPADVLTKIEAYKSAKAELKRELRDAVLTEYRGWSSSKRYNAHKELAGKQAPEIARLDDLADDVRRALSAHPGVARPAVMGLPLSIAPRVQAYHQRKVAAQSAMLAKLHEVKVALPGDRVEYVDVGGKFVLQVTPASRASNPNQRTAIVASLDPFNREQAKIQTELALEKETLRAAIIHEASVLSANSNQKTIEQLLEEFASAFRKAEVESLYDEYATAVFEPGLSPAQRRILFGAALEKLNLPL